jgi:ferrous iron transport protein A
MSSLAQLPSGARGVVSALPESRGLARRLISLGLTPGAEVLMLQNRGRGPVILEVHGARLAVGRGQAERIDIRVLMPGDPSSSKVGPPQTGN